MSCTSINPPTNYDGATFSTCSTDNCNYDNSLAQSSNGKSVSSCYVGGSFAFSDRASSSFNTSSCPPSSNSYCLVIFLLNQFLFNFTKSKKLTLFQNFQSKNTGALKRCAAACIPGSFADSIRIPSTDFFLSQTETKCCQGDNCNGVNKFGINIFLIVSAAFLTVFFGMIQF